MGTNEKDDVDPIMVFYSFFSTFWHTQMYKSVDLVVELNVDLEQQVAEQVIVAVSLLHLGANHLGNRGGRQPRVNIHFLVSFSLSQCNVFLGGGWACF